MDIQLKPPLKLEWTAGLELGVPILDEQHKKLLEIVNDLYVARFEQDRQKIDDVLNELSHYIKIHFATEEALMTQANFEGLEEHKLEHARMIQKVKLFSKTHAKGADIANELQLLLNSWLLDHTVRTDKHYGEHIKKLTLFPDKATTTRWEAFVKKFK